MASRISALKAEAVAFNNAVAVASVKIAATGKIPERIKPEEETLVCKSSRAMLAFFDNARLDVVAGEAVEVYGWYPAQVRSTVVNGRTVTAPAGAAFILTGKFSAASDRDGNPCVSVQSGGKGSVVDVRGLGWVERENPRRAGYLAMLKAWGITEKAHRARYTAYQTRRKVAADSVPLAEGQALMPSPTATDTAKRTRTANKATAIARTRAPEMARQQARQLATAIGSKL